MNWWIRNTKKVYLTLNDIDDSLVAILIDTARFAVKYKSIITKKEKTRWDSILAKAKLISTETLISRALTDAYINYDINYNYNFYKRINKKSKSFNTSWTILIYLWSNVIILLEV